MKTAKIKYFLEFDDEIKKNILSNEDFTKFINQIEISLNNFLKLNNIDFKAQLYFEKDFEIPDLKKLILSIDIEDLSTQEKLDMWDQIDDFIRKDIENATRYLSDNEKAKFFDLNLNFFTNIELN